MAVELLGGAAIGAVFGELLKAVLEAKDKVKMFKPLLERLESTLRSKEGLVKEIEQLNRELDRPKEETEDLIELMKKGKELVDKCSKINWLNIKKKHKYAKELEKLDASIAKFIQGDLQLQQARDQRQSLVLLNRLITNGKVFNQNGGFVGSCAVPGPPVHTVGLDLPMEELKTELLEDQRPVIVLSGPGGCGKTTLAKLLGQDEKVKDKFKTNILYITMSRTPNLMIIIQRIFQQKGFAVPEFQSDEDALNHLEQLLRQIGHDPILLILDDAWSGSDFLIEKFVFQLPNYKILVTSRSEFPRFGPSHRLTTLNDDDALDLFRHSAFLQDGNSYAPDEDLVKQVLRGCKGYPLALKVVGGSLRGQPATIWRRQVMESSKGVSIFDSNAELLDCLKISLDALNNEVIVKESFMDLGSFPEDQRISASILVDIGVELYPLDGEDINAMSNLHLLSDRNLVNLVVTRKDKSEENGFFNGILIWVHDMLRELAIYQSSLEPIEKRKRLIVDINGNNVPNWWLDQEPCNARLLSISTDETFSSNWCNLQVPEVEALVLNLRSRNYTFPKFVEKMDKLKVLIVTNYGFFPVEIINLPLICSLTSLKRIRLEKVYLPSSLGTTSCTRFVNLQKISLVMCNVDQAFRNSDIQIADALPNLVEIDIDYCNDLVALPNGLCDVVCLKRLSVTNCHKLRLLPQRIGKLVNLEALRLNSCTDLLTLPDSIGQLSKLNFLDISECMNISKLPRQIGNLCSLRRLCMVGCSCDIPSTVVNLEQLKEVRCDEETSYSWEPFRSDLTNLVVTVPEEDEGLNFLHNHQFR